MAALKALVLAAGGSTRIAGVSAGHPKPLIRIGGETILGRNLRWLAQEGIQKVWINLHFKPEEIRAAIGDDLRFGVGVRYIYEPEILGTAGAVRNLASEWDNTFLVVYGDNLIRMDLHAFLHFHSKKKTVASIALFDRRVHPNTGIIGGYVNLAADWRILAFHEGVGDGNRPLVNTGVYLLEPEVIKEIPGGQFYDFGRDLFPRLLSEGKEIYGYVIPSGYCLGIDTPECYQRAIDLIQKGEVTLS